MARGRLSYLSAAEREFIHEQTVRVLADVGIGYNSPAAIEQACPSRLTPTSRNDGSAFIKR